MSLHYVEHSSHGPTLLLLHGVTRNGHDWDELVPRLADRWRVITIDHQGHGRSERVSGRYRVVDYARATTEFVRASFAAESLTVMGHSLGAMVGLWLAAECRSEVRQLVLEDPPFHTMGDRIGSTPYQAQFAGMHTVARRGGDIERMTDSLAEIRIPSPPGTVKLGEIRDPASLRFSAECLSQVDPDIFVPLVAGKWLDGFDHESLWSRVACPVVLLQGDAQAGGTLTDADAAIAAARLAHSELIRFEGVGHQIHATCPDQVIAVLGRIRESVDSARRSAASE